MAEKEKSNGMVVTLGDKGSPLTSSSVYAVANCLAQVTIHPSILHNLTSCSSSHSNQTRFLFKIHKNLNDDQSRAILLITLHKLVISSSSVSGITPSLLSTILHLLNQFSGDLRICRLEVNAVELHILNNSAAALIGIFTLIDHEASSLSAVLDVVAALGSEASRANVSVLRNACVNDAFSLNEETCVTSHLKILLNGYDCVGQSERADHVQSVSAIPKLHGFFRQVVASLNSIALVELNTSTKAGSAIAMSSALMPLLKLLRSMCENVTCRSSIIAKSLGSLHEAVKKYESQCPKTWNFTSLYQSISSYMFTANHVGFVQPVHQLLRRTICMVRWEAVLAFTSFQGDSARADKRSGKTKMGALGQGNAIILQHIRDTIESQHFNVKEGIFEILDPKNPKFDCFLKKIKETLDTNVLYRITYSELGREVNVAKATLQRFIEEDSSLRNLIESLKTELLNVKKEVVELNEKETEAKLLAEDMEAELQKSKFELETCLTEESKVSSICDGMMVRLFDLLSGTEKVRQEAEDIRLETEAVMKVAEVDRNLMEEYEAKLILLQEAETVLSAEAEAIESIKLSGAQITLSKEDLNSLKVEIKDSTTIADMNVCTAMVKMDASKKDNEKMLEASQKELEKIKFEITKALEMEAEAVAGKNKLEEELLMLRSMLK